MADSKKINLWECSICGCLIEDEEAPIVCPLCENENVFFIKQENLQQDSKNSQSI